MIQRFGFCTWTSFANSSIYLPGWLRGATFVIQFDFCTLAAIKKNYKVENVVSFSFSKAKIIGGFVAWTLLTLLFLSILALSLFGHYMPGIIVGAFFFALLLLAWLDTYKFLRKYQQGVPALALTPEGLIDNTNNITFAWKDIEAFKDSSVNMGKGARKTSIAICLYNDTTYVSLVQGLKGRLIAQLNSRFFGGAFSIETNAIKENRLDVLQSLNEFKEKYSG